MTNPGENKYLVLSGLIHDLLTERIDEESKKQLYEMLDSDYKSLQYYVEYINLWTILEEVCEARGAGENDNEYYSSVMESMAEYERTAPSLEVERQIEQPRRQPKPIKIEKASKSISRFSLSAALLSAAALIVMFISAYFGEVPMPVGILTDAYDAEWASEDQVVVGDSLENVVSRHLLSGYAEITFDNGAKAVLEGPVKFKLETVDSMFVDKGKVYTKVNNASAGFTVNTPYAKIVDLGTEFGVDVDKKQSEVHVYKGKVKLFAQNDQAEKRRSEDITASQARRINSYNNDIETISFSQTHFKRQVPSEYEQAILAAGPLYYWQFDQSDSGILVNCTGSQYGIGKYSSIPSFIPGPELRQGQTNRALRLSKDLHVDIQDKVFRQINTGEPFTYIVWVKVDKAEAGNILVSTTQKDGAAYSSRILAIDENGRFADSYYKHRKLTETAAITSKMTVEKDQWYMVALTSGWETDRFKRMYVNGEFEGSFLRGETPPNPQWDINKEHRIYIGNSPMMKDRMPINGAVDEIAIFDRDLSLGEIRALYELALRNNNNVE